MPSGDAIAETVRQALGVQYVWGGQSMSGFDCSGLTYWAYAQYGIQLPRTSYEQINVGYNVPVNKLHAGDLVFFDTDRSKGGPDHVGIYMGGGKFIHAARPGQPVKISSLGDSYYMNRLMAARRVPGVEGAGAMAVGELGVAQPHLDAPELAETYGMSYAFFKSQPELMKLLKSAVADQWTSERFAGALKNTKWWRTTSKTAREFQVLSQTDPATAKAQLAAQRVMLQQAAVKMGAILTGKQLDKAARDSLAYGWNEAQVQNFLGSYIKFQEDHTLGGMAGTAAKQITGMAYANGVRMSEQTVKNYAQYVVKGVSTMQQVEDQIRQQAMGAYPAFAEQIKAGASVRDIAQPYIQAMAQELGVPDVDLFTPQVKQALNRMDDKGAPAPMSLTDFQQLLRNDPRWGKQPGTADKTLAVGRQVLKDMGLGY
jgi:hypothetical protein